MKPLDMILYVGLATALLAVAVLIFRTQEGDADWDRFRTEHRCERLGQEDGSNRAGWRCEDGKVYYRWRQQR